jgi:hypothetical protein
MYTMYIQMFAYSKVRGLDRGAYMCDGTCADNLELKFGGMISACNHVAAADIEVTCSGPCLWMSTTKQHDESDTRTADAQ